MFVPPRPGAAAPPGRGGTNMAGRAGVAGGTLGRGPGPDGAAACGNEGTPGCGAGVVGAGTAGSARGAGVTGCCAGGGATGAGEGAVGEVAVPAGSGGGNRLLGGAATGGATGTRGTAGAATIGAIGVGALENGVSCTVGRLGGGTSAKSSRTDVTGAMAITPPQTEHRARTGVSGSFAGSIRNIDRHSGQVTFTASPPPGSLAAMRESCRSRDPGAPHPSHCSVGPRSRRCRGVSSRNSSFPLRAH